MVGLCKKCKQTMVCYPGDDECMDCAYPLLKQASDAAAQAVVDGHFKRTGEIKTAGELMRNAIGIF